MKCVAKIILYFFRGKSAKVHELREGKISVSKGKLFVRMFDSCASD